jgi:hypothetical protein
MKRYSRLDPERGLISGRESHPIAKLRKIKGRREK